METRNSALGVFEKLEAFVGKLPGALQKPILQEITPLKDLFLRQRPPRLVLAGDPVASSASLFNAIFSAPVAPLAADGSAEQAPVPAGWQDFSHAGRGVLRLLETRLGPVDDPLPAEVAVALELEAPDLILYLRAADAATNEGPDLARLERLLDQAEKTHGFRPCVVGVAVDASELGASASELSSARNRVQSELSTRTPIARHLAPTQAVATFMRFRLDGTFDPESDRRRHVADLVDILVAELPNEARLEMARLSGARAAQAKIAQTLVKSFTAVSGALGAQPIPLADLPFLLGFQVAMVAGIIYISGRELSLKLATQFLGTLGFNLGLGLIFREGARAAVRAAAKLLLPGIGNAISGLVAAGGTYAVGRAATAYYIEGASLADARQLFKRAQRADGGIFHLLERRKNVSTAREHNGH